MLQSIPRDKPVQRQPGCIFSEAPRGSSSEIGPSFKILMSFRGVFITVFVIKKLRDEKLLTPDPFDEPIKFVHFDLWHYFGRTAKLWAIARAQAASSQERRAEASV